MQVASLFGQESALSLLMNGLQTLRQGVTEAALQEQTNAAIDGAVGSTVGDILDIQQGLQRQLASAEQYTGADMAETPEAQQALEQFAAFESQVVALFESLFEKAQEMFANADFAQFSFEVEATKGEYFAMSATLTIEMQFTTVQDQPFIPDLTNQALETVGAAQISDRDKQTLIELIAMIDEFVKSAAHDHLMRGVIGIVPLMEQVSSSATQFSILSVEQTTQMYLAERVMLRQETGTGDYSGQQYNAQASYYSVSMSFRSESISYFSAEA